MFIEKTLTPTAAIAQPKIDTLRMHSKTFNEANSMDPTAPKTVTATVSFGYMKDGNMHQVGSVYPIVPQRDADVLLSVYDADLFAEAEKLIKAQMV